MLLYMPLMENALVLNLLLCLMLSLIVLSQILMQQQTNSLITYGATALYNYIPLNTSQGNRKEDNLKNLNETPPSCETKVINKDITPSYHRPLVSASIPSNSVALNRPTVHVICFQKDEVDLLEFWIQYYGKIFGYESLIILDNFSTHAKVIPILYAYEQKGVQVHYKVGPYRRKSLIIMEIIRKYRTYTDLFVITDIDEYLTAFDSLHANHIDNSASHTNSDTSDKNPNPKPSKPIIDRNAIWRHLTLFFHSNYSALRMLPSYNSIVTSPNDTILDITYFQPYYYASTHCKILYRANDVIRIDHGNHYAHIRKKNHSCTTHVLGFLHYHNRNPFNTIYRAMLNGIGLKQLPINTTLDSLPEHHEYLVHMATQNHTQGYLKLMELLQYLDHGIDGIITHIFPTANNTQFQSNHTPSASRCISSESVIQLPTLPNIINQLV